ncbi:MAG: hypothetical protein IMW89_17680 [Ktedonobacteraceae bacterium]|nr:hypothetical protein [Ktedonobacteraceae bacterium]
MIEIEANETAEKIRRTGLPDLVVEGVERHGRTGFYRIRCRYTGPTFQREGRLFLTGMRFWISSVHEWTRLCRLLRRG